MKSLTRSRNVRELFFYQRAKRAHNSIAVVLNIATKNTHYCE